MRHHGFPAPSWDDLRVAVEQQTWEIDETSQELDVPDVDHQVGLLACKFASEPKEALQ